MKKEDWGIYFHIPFCERRCNYCDFFSTAGCGFEKIEQYFSYLSREFELFSRGIDKRAVHVHSIYFGGGTPSYAPASEITSLLLKILTEFDITESIEITVEVNPHSALKETLSSYREAGVNRLSIGVQSLNPDELTILERIHSADAGFSTVETARKTGFSNISIDFIYGISGQTMQSWKKTLEGAAAMQPEHVSAYMLMLEKGTKMTGLVQSGVLPAPDEDIVAEMYEHAHSYLEKSGYEHYEVSNFAKPGYASQHNVHYWKRKPYKGFGMSAHSYHNNTRSWNTTDFASYFSAIDNGTLPTEGSERLSLVQQINEEIMLRLRMRDGLSFREFALQFGRHAADILKQKINELLQDKNAERYFHPAKRDERVRLTSQGFLVSDKIISQLLLDESDFATG